MTLPFLTSSPADLSRDALQGRPAHPALLGFQRPRERGQQAFVAARRRRAARRERGRIQGERRHDRDARRERLLVEVELTVVVRIARPEAAARAQHEVARRDPLREKREVFGAHVPLRADDLPGPDRPRG